MDTASVLTLNPENKQQIDFFATDIVAKVKNGELNPLEVYIRLKAIAKTGELINEQIRDEIMHEVDKHPEKSFKRFGSEIEKAETGVKYDFSQCGDVAWTEAHEQEKAWKAKRDEREKFLKMLKKPIQICDETTGGESVELQPPVKTSTSFIKVTHK